MLFPRIVRRLKYAWQGRPWVKCAACGIPVPVDILPPEEPVEEATVLVGLRDGRPRIVDRWASKIGRYLPQSPDEGFLYDSTPVGPIEPNKAFAPWSVVAAPFPHDRRWVCSMACSDEIDRREKKEAVLAQLAHFQGGPPFREPERQ